jgi:hypothetical protein
MPDLQRLHEAVLGRTLRPRNFQQSILELGIATRLAEERHFRR